MNYVPAGSCVTAKPPPSLTEVVKQVLHTVVGLLFGAMVAGGFC